MAQLSNLIVNGVTRLLSKLYVSDSVTAPNFIGKLTGTAAKLGRNGDADTPMTFNWSGKDGQPTWLWGGENGSDMYVYNPSNFNVNNAKTAGSADSATKLSSSAGSATQPVYFSDGKPVATTYTLGKSVPASAVFTDTNTWRGVQNNLISDATDQSLSAAQGKVLKGLVDGKAPSGHTHDDRYYTESEIDSKLSGKANNHSHPYLPLAGGTMSGTITFAAIGDKGTSAGLAFSGSTDGAGIYYQTTAGDQGNLVLNLTDDDNCYLQIAKNGAFKSYFSPDGVFHGSVAGNASSASSVAWSNVTGKPSTFTPAGHTHTKSQITDFPALGTAAAKNVRTLTARGSSGWKNTATDQQYVPDMSFIANWNGSYDGTGSNLVYCCMGAFGTIVTKNTSDYAVAGHTHNYAGSSSAGGAATSANKVNAALTINLNGTSQGAWDGSSAKSISITAASVGATSVTISRW